jgi:formylglycine-generating enzyme required for sulfatase activity
MVSGLCVLAGLTTAAQVADVPKTWVQTQAGSPTGPYLVIDLTPSRIAVEEQTDPKTPPKTVQGFVVSNLDAVPPGGWSDEYKTTKLVLRRIPAGTLMMGSPADEVGRDSDETQHSVTLTKDFYIGVFEVTMRQWELVMGKAVEDHSKRDDKYQDVTKSNIRELHTRPAEMITFFEIRESPTTDVKAIKAMAAKRKAETVAPPTEQKALSPGKSEPAAKKLDSTMIGEGEPPPDSPEQTKEERDKEERAKAVARNEEANLASQPSDDPKVDWPANSAVNPDSFFGKLRAKTMLAGLDLPTEAQWEYACRAGTTTALNSGKALTQGRECPNLAEVGRSLFNVDLSEGWRYNRWNGLGTAAVGSYAPNKWGLYDMHGDVWEWCLDWYAPFSSEAATDPKGPATGQARVLRGGSWDDRAKACRAANRGSMGFPSGKSAFFGFRAAMTAP